MVGDDPNSNQPSRKAGLLPPRPNEIENAPPPLSSAQNESDAAQDLFEMFQELKKKSSHHVSQYALGSSGIWLQLQHWFGPQHLWKWLVASVVVVAAITTYFKHWKNVEETVAISQPSVSETQARQPASGRDKVPNPNSVSANLRKYQTPPPSFSAITRRINSAPPVQQQEVNDPPPQPEYNNDPPPENQPPAEAAQSPAPEPSPQHDAPPPAPADPSANPEQEHSAAQPEQTQDAPGPDVQTQN